jgi:hypothetical protein
MMETAASLGKRHLLGGGWDRMRYQLGIPLHSFAPITLGSHTLLLTLFADTFCIWIMLTRRCPLKAHNWHAVT